MSFHAIAAAIGLIGGVIGLTGFIITILIVRSTPRQGGDR